MNTAQASWVPMYIQVWVSVIHTIQPVISLKASLESTEHQITKHQTVAAEKKVTTGLNRRFSPNVPHFKLTRSQRHFCEAFSSISMTVLRDLCARRCTKDCGSVGCTSIYYWYDWLSRPHQILAFVECVYPPIGRDTFVCRLFDRVWISLMLCTCWSV